MATSLEDLKWERRSIKQPASSGKHRRMSSRHRGLSVNLDPSQPGISDFQWLPRQHLNSCSHSQSTQSRDPIFDNRITGHQVDGAQQPPFSLKKKREWTCSISSLDEAISMQEGISAFWSDGSSSLWNLKSGTLHPVTAHKPLGIRIRKEAETIAFQDMPTSSHPQPRHKI